MALARDYLLNWFENPDDSKELFVSLEVRMEFAALAAAALERLDEELSMDEQLENDLFRLEPISLPLPRLAEPFRTWKRQKFWFFKVRAKCSEIGNSS